MFQPAPLLGQPSMVVRVLTLCLVAHRSLTATLLLTLGYATATDSTITAFDTVAVGIAAAESGDYKFQYAPGGAVGASFSGVGVTSTNGVITFTSTYNNDVTARYSAVAANASTGDAAVFIDGSGINYLFVKGASDNLVVQVGTASVSGGLNDAGLQLLLVRPLPSALADLIHH